MLCLSRFILKLKNYTDPAASAHERDFCVLWWEPPADTQTWVWTPVTRVCVCVSSACAASLCCRWPCSAPDESRRSDTRGRSPITSEYVILRVLQIIQTLDVSLTLVVFVCRAHRGLGLRPGLSECSRRTHGLAPLRCLLLTAVFVSAGAARCSFLSRSSRWRPRTSASPRSSWALTTSGSRRTRSDSEAAVRQGQRSRLVCHKLMKQ